MERYINRKAGVLLAGSAGALLAGWAFVAFMLDPAIRAPSPWTQIISGFFLAGLWLFITFKVPLTVSVRRDQIQFRLLLWRKVVRLADITSVEYRTQSTNLVRPMAEREYAVTIRHGARRLADVGIDGRIASRLMCVLDSSRSIERTCRGRQVVEERAVSARR